MKSNSTSSLYGRWAILLAVLIAAAGLALSIYLRTRIAKTEAETVRLTAAALRLNTEQEMVLFTDVLESVRALHALSDAVNQAAMDEFIEKGLVHQHAVLGTFGLVQHIGTRLRMEIEQKEKNQPGAYDVVQRGESGAWVPAPIKTSYYPLTWQSRPDGLHIPIGFDFSSEPAALQTIQRIERTRRTSLVKSPLTADLCPPAVAKAMADRPASDTPSYWVFSPVIPGRTYAFGPVIGLAVAVFHPDTVLRRVTERSVPSTQLQLRLADGTLSDAETVRRIGKTWRYCGPLQAIDAQWMFECTLPSAITGHRSETAFAGGLVITALLTSLLLILGGRTRKIEAEVTARTEELRIANTRLEEHLLERMRMEEEISELAARERRRIGRDLHDSLGQHLTGAVFLSRALLNWLKDQKAEAGCQKAETHPSKPVMPPADPPRRKTPNSKLQTPNSKLQTHLSHAKTLNETLKAAVSQVRNMARGLASITLNDESLEESLHQLAEEMSSLYDIPCEMTQTGQLPALNRQTKEQLYFIAREAVNNAARHAEAGRITIQLRGEPSGWTLRIQDDGKGLPEPQPSACCEGMGLRTMRHRAGLIGADLSLRSAPGQGVVISVTRMSE